MRPCCLPAQQLKERRAGPAHPVLQHRLLAPDWPRRSASRPMRALGLSGLEAGAGAGCQTQCRVQPFSPAGFALHVFAKTSPKTSIPSRCIYQSNRISTLSNLCLRMSKILATSYLYYEAFLAYSIFRPVDCFFSVLLCFLNICFVFCDNLLFLWPCDCLG